MSKQDQIDELKAMLYAKNMYAEDLKRRHDTAIDALSDLARGLGRKVESSEWKHAMQCLASEELARIAKMPLRTP